MRAVIVLLIVCALAVYGVLNPFVGLMGWMWFVLMRPDYFSWSQAMFPYSAVLEACTLLGSVRFVGRLPVVFQSSITRWLLLYQLPAAVSVATAINPAVTLTPYVNFLRVLMIVLLIPLLVDSLDKLRWLFFVVCFSFGMIGFKFGVWGLIRGGATFHEGYAGLDNNALALAMAMTVPILWFARSMTESRLARLLLLGLMFTCMATVVMTRSRGASLALGTTLVLLAFRSKHKVLVLSLMAALSVIPVALIYQRYMMRMSALSDPLSDPSIRSRLVHFRAALRVARDYPLTGVGFGNENYQLIQDRYIPEVATGEFRRLKVHNTYLQVLVDSGIFAFGIFVYLLISTLVQLQRSIRRCRRDYPHLLAFPYALQVALVSYAQYCLTGGRESWDFYYILLMTTVTWLALEKEVRRSLSAEPAPAMAPALPPLAAPVAGYSGQPGPSKPAVPAPGRSRYRFLDVRR